MIIRGEITREKLQHIYNTIHEVIQNQQCYYTKEEILKLKMDDKNVFIESVKK